MWIKMLMVEQGMPPSTTSLAWQRGMVGKIYGKVIDLTYLNDPWGLLGVSCNKGEQKIPYSGVVS